MQAALEESGGGVLGARVKSARRGGFANEDGLTVGRRWVVRGVGVAVRLKSDWVHDFDSSGSVKAAFVGAPSSSGWFSSRAGSAGSDAFKLNGSVEFTLTERVTLRIGSEYELRKGSSKKSLTISVGVEF